MYQAIALGFCGKLAGLARAISTTRRDFKDDKAVGDRHRRHRPDVQHKVFAEKGWAPPTSWNDLKDPKYKKQLVIPPINNTYGLHALLMLARINGGGEDNVDAGFKIFKERDQPNVLAYEPSPGKMTELFQSGQAVLGRLGHGPRASFANTGFPVDFVYPKEGAATLLDDGLSDRQAQCLAARLRASSRRCSSRKPSSFWLKDYGYGPVNLKSLVVPPELGRWRRSASAPQNSYTPDWAVINDKREEWTKRWNCEVER